MPPNKQIGGFFFPWEEMENATGEGSIRAWVGAEKGLGYNVSKKNKIREKMRYRLYYPTSEQQGNWCHFILSLESNFHEGFSGTLCGFSFQTLFLVNQKPNISIIDMVLASLGCFSIWKFPLDHFHI